MLFLGLFHKVLESWSCLWAITCASIYRGTAEDPWGWTLACLLGFLRRIKYNPWLPGAAKAVGGEMKSPGSPRKEGIKPTRRDFSHGTRSERMRRKSSQEKKRLFKPREQHKKTELWPRDHICESCTRLGGGEGCFRRQKMSWRRRQNWRTSAWRHSTHLPLGYLLCWVLSPSVHETSPPLSPRWLVLNSFLYTTIYEVL